MNYKNFNLDRLYPKDQHKKIPLTPYSSDEESFWFSEISTNNELTNDLYSNIDIITVSDNAFLISIKHGHIFFREHSVFEKPVLPAVAQLELVIKAISKNNKLNSIIFENTYWISPIFSEQNQNTQLTLLLNKQKTDIIFKILSDTGILHSQGSLRIIDQPLSNINIPFINKPSSLKYEKHYIYKIFKDSGIKYGSYFQGINNILVTTNETKAKLILNPKNSIVSLLDAALQSSMAESINNLLPGLMPFSLGQINFTNLKLLYKTKSAIVYTKKLSQYRADILVCDINNNPLLSIRDLGVKSTKHLSTEAKQFTK